MQILFLWEKLTVATHGSNEWEHMIRTIISEYKTHRRRTVSVQYTVQVLSATHNTHTHTHTHTHSTHTRTHTHTQQTQYTQYTHTAITAHTHNTHVHTVSIEAQKAAVRVSLYSLLALFNNKRFQFIIYCSHFPVKFMC